MSIVSPMWARVNAMNASMSFTGWPSSATIWSPTRSPATLAGEGLPSRVGWTLSTSGLVGVGAPRIAKNTKRKTTAITKCVAGPARMTSTRFQMGLAPNVRSRSSAGGSWKGFMPAIRT